MFIDEKSGISTNSTAHTRNLIHEKRKKKWRERETKWRHSSTHILMHAPIPWKCLYAFKMHRHAFFHFPQIFVFFFSFIFSFMHFGWIQIVLPLNNIFTLCMMIVRKAHECTSWWVASLESVDNILPLSIQRSYFSLMLSVLSISSSPIQFSYISLSSCSERSALNKLPTKRNGTR